MDDTPITEVAAAVVGQSAPPEDIPTEGPADSTEDVLQSLNGMFDMSPLTSVIGSLLKALKEQKETINSLRSSLSVVDARTTGLEAKTDTLEGHISAVEGSAAAAREKSASDAAALTARVQALEELLPADQVPTAAPPDTDAVQKLIEDRMGVIDGALAERFEQHKSSLPDFTTVCDARISIFFGNSELLKDFSHKISEAHAVAEKFPDIERQTKEFGAAVVDMAARLGPQGDLLQAVDGLSRENAEQLKRLRLQAEEDERIRARARKARSTPTASTDPEDPAPALTRERKGVKVASQRRTMGIMKVSSAATLGDDEEVPVESFEQAPPSDGEEQEVGGGAAEAPLEEGGEDRDPFGEDADLPPVTLEPVEQGAQSPEDMQEIAAEVAQIVEDSIDECYDAVSVDSGSRPASPEQRRIPPLEVAAVKEPKVMAAYTRDIQPLDKANSFQYKRPMQVKEHDNKSSLLSQSFSVDSSSMSRPQSGPQSGRSEEQRQMSARRKQMLKDTLQTRMNSMDIPALVDRGEKHGERVRQDPSNSLHSRLRVVEEILQKLPNALSGKMDNLRIELSRQSSGIGATAGPGPNIRNELIQIFQTTEGVRKKVASLETKLNGVIQASLDGQSLDANVEEPETEEEPAPEPVIQYIPAPPIVQEGLSGLTLEEVTAEVRRAVDDATRSMVSHQQCHDLILAAFDKPRKQQSEERNNLAEWKQDVTRRLEELSGSKVSKEGIQAILAGTHAEVALKLGRVKDEVFDMVNKMKDSDTEALMRLHAKQDSLTAYVTKLDIEVSEQLRPVMTKEMKEKLNTAGGREAALENKMSAFEKKSYQIHSMQMEEIQKLVDSLQTVEHELQSRPKEKQIQAMVTMIEEEFKKILGHNVGGMQQTIQRIVDAVHSKAGKTDVVKLISSSIATVHLDIEKINSGEIPAGGYKCISCGHSGATVRLMSGVPSSHRDGSSPSPHMTDDASIGSAVSLLSDPSTAAVLHRKAGLRPLGGYSEPQDPKVAARAEKKKAAQDHIKKARPNTSKEPLYRRARLAAQLREIPKVTPVDLGHLPQYAMDDDDISMDSMFSQQSRLTRNAFHTFDGVMSQSTPSEALKLPQVSPVRSSPSPGKSSMLGDTDRPGNMEQM